MGKRILSWVLSLAMILGMVPGFAIAAENEIVYKAAYAAAVNIDGNLSEVAWGTDADLTDGTDTRAFGALWNGENLYIAVVPKAGDTTVTVEVGSATAVVTSAGVTGVSGASAAWGSAVEILLPLASLGVALEGYNQEIAASVSVGQMKWEGKLCLEKTDRKDFAFAGASGTTGTGDNANLLLTKSDGNHGFTMSNRYVAGAANVNKSTRIYLAGGIPVNMVGKDLSFEFDFVVDKMPVYTAAADLTNSLDGFWACYGFNMMLKDANSKGYSFGITNTDDGLYLCVLNADGSAFNPIKLGKTLGQQFHLRFCRTVKDKLEIYLDGQLLDELDNPTVNPSWGVSTSIVNCNLWSGSGFPLTADGANDVSFTLSNAKLSQRDNAPLAELSFADIAGSNESHAEVTKNLNLISTWHNDILNADLELTWSSSNPDVVSNEGVVTRDAEDHTVVLTAALKNDPDVTHEILITVSGKRVESYFVDIAPTVDGNLNEAFWPLAPVKEFEVLGAAGAPAGSVRSVMHKGIAYLAVAHGGADTLQLKVGEKVWTLDLTKSTIAETGMTAAVGSEVVEICLDLPVLGMKILNYGQSLDLEITLEKGDAASSLDANVLPLRFVQKKIATGGSTYTSTEIPLTGAVVNGDFVTATADRLTIKGAGMNAHTKCGYWLQKSPMTMMDATKDMLLEQTLNVVSMPVTAGGYANQTAGIGAHLANGLIIMLEDANQVYFSIDIFNAGDQGLMAYVWQKDTTAEGPFALGVKTGETFKLGALWSPDNTVTLLVNDKKLTTVANATGNKVYGENVLMFKYYDLNNTDTTAAEIVFTDVRIAVDDEIKPMTYSPVSIPMNGATINGTYVTQTADLLTIKGTGMVDNTTCGFWIQQTPMTMVDSTRDMLLEQTLKFVTMPASKGGFSTTTPYLANGLLIMLEETGSTLPFCVSIFNDAQQGLMAYVWRPGGTTVGPFALGVKVGDTFKFGILRSSDDTMNLMVNNKTVATVVGVTTYNYSVYKTNTLLIKYFDSVNTATTQAEIQVSNLQMTVAEELNVAAVENIPSLPEELKQSVLLPGLDLENIKVDITLPATAESQYLGTLPLTWTSDNEENLSHDGKVTRPDGRGYAYSDLTAAVTGGCQLWKATVRIPGLGVGADSTASHLLVPFTSTGVTVNGAKDDSDFWNIGIKMLSNGSGFVKFGAQWDLNNLYLAIASTETATLKINGKAVSLSGASAGSILEAAIALKDLGIEPTDYGVELETELTSGSYSWKGTLILTSNDYFGANLTGASGSQKQGSGDAPTANQGVSADASNPGTYRFYDLYTASGTNPRNVRSYLILQGGYSGSAGIYEPMSDRTAATWCEFDFTATSMPVYSNSATTTGSAYFSNYGFNFALGEGRDEDNISGHIRAGIYNTVDGLVFCIMGNTGEGISYLKLNKYVGDTFRIGLRWETNGDCVIYLDGEEFMTVKNVEMDVSAYVNNGLVMNILRNAEAAKSGADSIDITVSNICLGKSYGDANLDAVTLASVLNENTDPYQVTTDLNMPASITNPQTGWVSQLTWTSSDPDVIDPETGKVTPPAGKGKLVTVTVTDGVNTKTFEIYVPGDGVGVVSNILIVEDDRDSCNGAAYAKDMYQFTLDDTNNSVVIDLGSAQKVNVVKLTDSDGINRLNESVLSVLVSDDNVTYTRVDSFKILRAGRYTYLYDFEAEGRYIKVHCTHYNGAEADFTGPLEGMLDAYYENVFGAGGGTFSKQGVATVTNESAVTKYDTAWTVPANAVAATRSDKADVRFYLANELLYHYYDGENYQVRIPRVGAGETVTLLVLSGNAQAMDISSREYVDEVVYGNRESYYEETRRWQTTLPDGTVMAIFVARDEAWEDLEGDLNYNARLDHIQYAFSYNGGLTWTDGVKIANSYSGNLTQDGWINAPGGIYYDPDVGDQGRIVIHGYYYVTFNASNMNASKCYMRFMYSDDMGKTWVRCPEVQIRGEQTHYYLSYTNPLRVSSYDGTGSGVDYVVPAGTQYDSLGRFCCRVLYTCDAGITWIMSESRLMMEGEGIASMEGGLSEAAIAEDMSNPGNLVLYVRCQYDSVNTFARAYSSDCGKTWGGVELSDVYTPNTQPIMLGYHDDVLMFWGGNNVLGGNSYKRYPMSVGILSDDLMQVERIQDLYLRYSFQNMNSEGERITNPLPSYQGDTLTLSWWGSTCSPVMRVLNFTDFLYRTKGAYDSFESCDPRYEGWSTYSGRVVGSAEYSTEGERSMLVDSGASVSRSIPYLRDGKISLDLYITDGTADLTLELESAYSEEYGEAAPIGMSVSNGVITFLGAQSASGLTLKEGWNNLTFDLNLSAATPSATVTINGVTEAVPVRSDIGDYICYVDIANNAKSSYYVDDFCAVDNDVQSVPETEAEVDNVAAAAVEALIDAIGDVKLDDEALIKAARAAYDALTEEQKEQVSNYDELVAAEEALARLKALPRPSVSVSLTEKVVLNFYVDEALVNEENQLVVKYNGEALDASRYEVVHDAKYKEYRISIPLNANNMCEELSLQILDANGNPLTQERTESIRSYVRLRLNNANAPVKEKRVFMAALEYGTLAQLALNPNATDLANSVITDADSAFFEGFTWPTATNAADAAEGDSATSKFAVTASLKDAVVLNFYIYKTDLGTNKIQIKRNGNLLTVGEDYTVTEDSKEYCVSIPMNANHMCDIFSAQVVDAEGNAVHAARSLSMRHYVGMRLVNPNADVAEKRVFVAALDYGALAQLAMNESATDLANRYITDSDREALKP